jgi:phage terminase large subunit-like protein
LLASLPKPELKQFQASLSEAEGAALEYDWEFWGRKNQLPPSGDWSVWAIIAGRGFGKTRAGAEWVRDQMCGDTPLAPGKCQHMALVGETAADVRKVMVGDGRPSGEGSGILQIHPADFRPVYNPSLKRATWPNGAIASLYNATEPEELRGPEHGAAWCDELAKWRYAQETWDQLQFGLRVGDPRVAITTTPRPIKLLKEILNEPGTRITTGSTYDNAANLSDKFIQKITDKYSGTRLGRQELLAEILEDVPGALWTRAGIEGLRRKPVEIPPLLRVVVAIDPGSNSQGDDPDETGIIAAGLGIDGHGYILDDLSDVMTPIEWATRAIGSYRERNADRIVAEVNNGGEMVETTLRMVDDSVSYSPVWASRGKVMRAEPISALYEKGRVHHVGAFAVLEDQMCAFTTDFDRDTAGYSPDRLDALVWALTELMIQGGGRQFNFG